MTRATATPDDPHATGRARSRPLAADYTTPTAVALTRLRPERRGLLGLLRGGDYFASSGLYPKPQPTPDKIPLVLVHGLNSEPSDFHVLHNALGVDVGVRRRYWVRVFYYPTSLSEVYAAMLLREDIEASVHQVDRDDRHPDLHHAVLVGHSMDGVLCRLATSGGGDGCYHHFFGRPLKELRVTPNERELLRRAFYHRACPDVSQVIFIATPPRGSSLAGGLLGNSARLGLHVPATVRARAAAIFTRNRQALAAGVPLRPGSSLDSLSPRSPVVAAVNDLRMRAGVRLHSVLGNTRRGRLVERSTDGVVPYASSHLPQAESERIVPAGHTGTLGSRETAAEIIRVLK